jgi:hypothetical protein
MRLIREEFLQMQVVNLIQHLVDVVRRFLLGVVELTRKVLLGFVTAVMAGLGLAMVLGTFLALLAALALAGVKVQDDEQTADIDIQVIDITPALA